MKTYSVIATTTIKHEQVQSALISAFEGGSNYWYYDLARTKPKKTKYISEDCADDGFTLKSNEHDGKQYTINPDSYEKALSIMQSKYPHHFNDLVNDNGDATTGDVFLQILCFGDVELG